ncbi:MAG: GTP-binding protein [Acidibrevibacterium sp.]|uniref:flagellar biosynthesis protein FlhF n=1 Tax=Acidibrevibacterium sp. TaxID=2606776 RepID=UPI003D025FA8
MRLKLYRAPTMAEAMAALRRELGAEALILGSRRVAGGVEVTAALDPEAASPSGAAGDPLAAGGQRERREALAFHAVPEALAALLEEGDLATMLSRHFAFATLPLAAGAAPLLFVGPPGAGKTLTVARLATRLVLAGGAPLVISADGKRAGATEQLAAYTRLLDLNLLVASQPVSLARALTRRSEGAPVLIDAPGIDPFDPAAGAEISALAGAAGARVVLVLPAGLDVAEAADLAAAFAAAGALALVATRLDVARRLGGVLAAAAAGRLGLAEAGVGSGAADGLVPMTADFLAERLVRGVGPATARPPAEAYA